jgi:signal transduction histidine kinase
MPDVHRRLKLKDRATLALVAIVALFVSVQGLLAYLSLDEQEDDLADEWVLAEARRLAAHAERGELRDAAGPALLSASPTLQAWFVDTAGQTMPHGLPPELATLADGVHRPSGSGPPLHVAVLSTPAGRLYAQYDASASERRVERFGLYLLGLGTLCIALALAIARSLAGLVAAPIDKLAAQLSNWAPGSALHPDAGSDEEQRLGDAFRRMQNRFEQTIAHERELAANLSHEIRTPLAALRTDLELLALAEPDGSPRAARLQRALATADAVTAALQSAQRIERRTRAGAEAVDVRRCVDDAWESLGAYPGIEGLRFVNAVPPGSVVHGDRHALLTILRNLFRNAIEHAAPAECVVRYGPEGIEVADDGPGIAPEDLPFVFERYYRGRLADSRGSAVGERGIGLAIARQMADLNGWTLGASSQPGQGARFVLRLA